MALVPANTFTEPPTGHRFDHCPSERNLPEDATFCDECGEWDLDGSGHTRGKPCPEACVGCPGYGYECAALLRPIEQE